MKLLHNFLAPEAQRKLSSLRCFIERPIIEAAQIGQFAQRLSIRSFYPKRLLQEAH
jgi:hypothetical protein